MDVHDAPGELLDTLRRQNPQESCEAHQLDLRTEQDLDQPRIVGGAVAKLLGGGHDSGHARPARPLKRKSFPRATDDEHDSARNIPTRPGIQNPLDIRHVSRHEDPNAQACHVTAPLEPARVGHCSSTPRSPELTSPIIHPAAPFERQISSANPARSAGPTAPSPIPTLKVPKLGIWL